MAAWNPNPYQNPFQPGNYNSSGYVPSYTGNPPPSMTPTVTPMQQPQTMQPSASIQGRMVTSKEEALGVPVDFLGTPLFFPDLAHGVIYYKKFNSNTGAADFAEFRVVPQQPAPQPQPVQQNADNHIVNQQTDFAPLQDFQNLNDLVADMQDTIKNLEKEIDRLKKPANSSGKVVSKNESSDK